jgi:hypothetical protein
MPSREPRESVGVLPDARKTCGAAQRLRHRGVALGSVTVIATDKMGTLT